MRRTVSSLVVAVLMLSACDLAMHTRPEAETTRSAAPTRTRVAATPTPEPSAAVVAATPAPSPTPVPTPTATPTPTVPSTILSGLIRLDPSYVIAAGGGNIISAGGGNIIAAGGGNIISAGGGNIISAGGGNIISAGGGNYRTLAEASDETMLPVQGMVVVPVSLLTREQLGPAVKTDEEGRYTLKVPDSVWKDPAHKENIGIYAALPAESEQDPILTNTRLRYEQVLSPDSEAEPTLDEDVNQSTRYIRRIYEGHFNTALGGGMPFNLDGLPEPFFSQFSGLITGLQQARTDADLNEEQVSAVSRKIAGYVLANQDLEALTITKAFTRTGWWDGPDGAPLMPVVVDYMRAVRKAGSEKLSALSSADFVIAANEGREPEERYELLKGSDLCELLLDQYFLGDDHTFSGVRPVMTEHLGMTNLAYYRIGSAGRCLWIALGLFLQDAEHNRAIKDMIEAAGHEAP